MKIAPMILGEESKGSDGINTQYVAASICPELYTGRQPTDGAESVAVAKYKMPFKIEANSSGACSMYIFPQNPMGVGAANLDSAFIQVLNDATFTPNNGIQSVAAKNYAGPLAGAVATAVMQYKCVSFSVDFLPT
jgi:hypothetical protein